MKKKLFAFLALVVCAIMCLGLFVGCTDPDEPDPTEAPADPTEEPVVDETPEPVEEETFETLYPDINLAVPETLTADEDCDPEVPLVVGYATFSEKFSPYFADTSYDTDVAGMTQISLMMVDRSGQPIMNGLEGETRTYNGAEYFYYYTADLSVNYDEATDTTKYTAIIRPDMVFSDGTPITIDDVIFTYYVYLDTDYQGSTSLNSYDIVGLNEYRTQTSTAVYDKYATIADAIIAGEGEYTQEQYDAFYAKVDEYWLAELGYLANYVADNYWAAGNGELMPFYEGQDAEAVKANEAWAVMFASWGWGFGDFNEEGAFVFGTTGETFPELNPTWADFLEEAKAKYNNDASAYFAVELCDYSAGDPVVLAKETFITEMGAQDPDNPPVNSIEGIKKINDWCVEVTLNGYSATAVYSILGVYITPMHYYGDESLWDPENGSYGFPRGDLSIARSKTATPMGAGPYTFVSYENRVVTFRANEYYFKGAPLTKNLQFREMNEADKIAGIASGTIDAANDVSGSVETFAEIGSYNTEGGLQGDVIWTYIVDNNGYGYIGLNADTVLVDEPGSEASKNLRKAFATIIAVYREAAVDSYYADAASVIQYPISTVSWASPQPNDEGYEIAFSRDVNGNPIYTDDMTADEEYAAALVAAQGYFEAAGYTFADGVATAPAGTKAKTSYEVLVPGEGTGDHPSYAVLTNASAALATIGIELYVNDLTNTNVLWDALDAGTQELWTAAWGGAIDPDMYQIYHSSNVAGDGGTDSNHYHIRSAELDDLIMQARTSDDQNVRKALYKDCLDIILDWAVEVPSYQRRNCCVASPERIKLETVTPDVSTNWSWMAEIEKIQMYKG